MKIILSIITFFILNTIFSQNIEFQTYKGGFEQPVGVVFDSQGIGYVWEKAGKIKVIEPNGGNVTEILDISNEVMNVDDHGLLGFALDPDFTNNGYFYLWYTVEPRVLFPAENISSEDLFSATIGRCTRYTYKNGLVNGRKIILGELKNDGPPILGTTHGVGTCFFGADGSLMLSVGDGSLGDQVGAQGVQRGILTQTEQSLFQLRSQSDNSLSGKILRINKETGNGLNDNPNYEATNPRSARSRMFVKGLRNPYRVTSISQNVLGSGPGMFLVSDTGENAWEEVALYSMNDNGGWPHREGFDVARINEQFVTFPINPNASFKNPLYSWAHPNNETKGWGIDSKVNVDDIPTNVNSLPNSFNHTGTSSTANTFYPENIAVDRYSTVLRNTVLVGDYTQGRLMGIKFEENNLLPNFSRPNRAYRISNQAYAVVHLYTNPYDGYIYAIHYNNQGAIISKLILTGNFMPVANIKSDKDYINLNDTTIHFFGDLSYDNETEAKDLIYAWNFGDGITSNDINPVHSYSVVDTTPLTRTVSLTVTDGGGLSKTVSKEIYINNLAPSINTISVKRISDNSEIESLLIPANEFPSSTNVRIEVNASDDITASNNLIYSIQVNRHHDDHVHYGSVIDSSTTEAILLPEGGCGEGATYWFEILVRVTDSLGAETTYSRKIFQVCDGLQNQTITVHNAPMSLNKNLVSFTLNASTISGLPISYRRISGPIDISNSGKITFTGGLGNARVVLLQAGNATYSNAIPVYVDFEVNTYADVPTVPVANFAYNNACWGQKMNVTNTSTGGSETIYTWKLLDSNSNIVEESIEVAPAFTLPNNVGSGWFRIIMTATNTLGASNKDSGWFYAQNCGTTMPIADFYYNESEFCNNGNLRFINTSTGGVGTNYFWELIGPNFEIISTSNSPYAVFTLPYNYRAWYKIKFTVTNSMGSDVKESSWVLSSDCSLNAKVDSELGFKNIKTITASDKDSYIYPNPSSSIIYFTDFVLKNHTKYTIYDLSGRLVKKGYVEEFSLDISNFKNSVYTITFTDEVSNKVVTKKIIKN